MIYYVKRINKNIFYIFFLFFFLFFTEGLTRELPKITSKKELVRHKAYTLQYSEAHEQALWVAYFLTPSRLRDKKAERTNKFLLDSLVKTGSATPADYKGSAYDRGHLAPAGDMAWSEESMRESFYYSNMSPQVPAFNRGVWNRLEELVRKWARQTDTLYIVTGPVLRDGLSTIGQNKVAVPEYYYKVILDYKNRKGIGFILSNAPSSLPLTSFTVSIDSVEKITGIDFFYSLSPKEQDCLETDICIECWKWE